MLHLEKLGSVGPAIVLLHGWGQNLESLKPLAKLLSSTMQVYLFDLPGFGKSPAPEAVWDSFMYAEHIKQSMDQLGVRHFAVAGHSFGGKVAMSLAVKYPESVQKLVLMATSGLKRKRSFTGYIRFFSIRMLSKLVKAIDKRCGTKWFDAYFIARFGSKDYKSSGKMRPILVKSVNEDFTRHLASIYAPTLLLWGKNDQETPVEVAKRLHKAIADSTLHVFPHKDHYLYHDCGSHLLAYYMRDFLRSKNG